MAPFVLDVLKVVFLVLLYFFVYRAVRAVVVDVRGPASPRRTAPKAGPPAAPKAARASRRSGKQPTTIVLAGADGRAKSKGKGVTLNGTVQVGRAEACAVRVEDTDVSQFHARLFHRDDAWFVEDLGSTNGTYLNERKVTSASEVHAGDRLRVGRTILELRS